MANIYLMRHGKVSGEPALYGYTDVSVDGRVQYELANQVHNKLSFKKVVTSPLRRCAELAIEIEKRLPTVSVDFNPSFKEMNFGDVDGVPFEELGELSRIIDDFSRAPDNVVLPNGEVLEDFYHRVIDGWNTLIKQTNEDTLLIVHGGVIRVILAYMLDINWRAPKLYSRLQIPNGSITHLEVFPEYDNWVTVKSIGLSLFDIAPKLDN